MSNALKDTVDVLKVFPDKATDTWVFRYCLKGVEPSFVVCRRTFDWNVTNKRNSSIRNLVL